MYIWVVLPLNVHSGQSLTSVSLGIAETSVRLVCINSGIIFTWLHQIHDLLPEIFATEPECELTSELRERLELETRWLPAEQQENYEVLWSNRCDLTLETAEYVPDGHGVLVPQQGINEHQATALECITSAAGLNVKVRRGTGNPGEV